MASKKASGYPCLINSTTERDRLQRHELLAVETTWEIGLDQEHPGNGSLVDWEYGKLDCQVVKRVTATCKEKPGPTKFARKLQAYGPRFFSGSGYYYFDGYTGSDWPAHDPCGMGEPNHLKHVTDPHGNIYIR